MMHGHKQTKAHLLNEIKALRQELAVLQRREEDWQWQISVLGAEIQKLRTVDHSVLFDPREELTASHDALQRLINQLPLGIQVFDNNGLCVHVNQAHLSIFGVGNYEQLINSYNIFTNPIAQARGTAAAARRALKGETVNLGDILFTFQNTDASFGERIINVTLFPVYDTHGQVVNIVGLNFDVTERRQAEIAEREERLFLESLRATTTTLTSTLEIDEILNRMLDQVRLIVPHEAINIMLVEEGIGRIVTSRGYEKRGVSQEALLAIRLPLAEIPALHKVAESQQPIVSTYESYSWVRSYVSVPILLQNELIGFINLDSAAPAAFIKKQAERLKIFADHAAIAFGNARLYMQSRASEAALYKSEARYRDVVQDQTELICRLSTDFMIVFANEACCYFFGTPQADIIGTSIWSGMSEEDQRPMRALFASLTPENPVGTIEYRNIDVNKDVRWVEWRNRALFDETGDPIGYQVVGRDITEQKLAEQKLAKSEERYRLITELMSDYAFSYDVSPNGDCRRSWVTDGQKKVTGYDRTDTPIAPRVLPSVDVDDMTQDDNLENLATYNLYHLDEFERVKQEIRNVLQGQETQGEYRIITKSGEHRWIHMRRRPIWDETEQRVVRFYGVAQDITERKHAEQKLAESEERYRLITELMSDYAFGYDVGPQGELHRFWITEESFQKMTGHRRSEADTFELYHPDDLERVKQDLQKTIEGQDTQAEYRIITKTGTLHWIHLRRHPIWSEAENRVVRFYGVAQDITERKAAEEALVKERKLMRSLIDHLPDNIYVKDRHSRFVLNNAESMRILGVSRQEDLLGKSDFDFMPAERAQRWLDEHIGVMERDQTIRDQEIFQPWNEDERRWVAESLIPLRDDEGDVVGFIGINRDITQRKLAEKALRESEERYRLISELISDYAFAFDVDAEGGHHLSWITKESYRQVTGYEGVESDGSNILYHPDEVERVVHDVQNVIQGQEIQGEYRIITKSGEPRWIYLRRGLIWDEAEQRVVRFYGVAQDITERKKREEQLKFQAEILENISDAIIAADAQFNITSWNHGAQEIYGWAGEEVLGRNAGELFETTYLDGSPIPQPPGWAKQGYWKGDMLHRRKDRERIHISSSSSSMKDRNGDLIGTVAVLRDITQQKQTEKELQRYRDHLEELMVERTAQLEAANRELDAFAYSVSHDLRAPIRALNNYSLFLEQDCAELLDEKCQTYVQGIAESAQHMERLVMDLLEYSRINRSKVSTTTVDILHLLETVVTHYSLRERAKLSLPSTMPAIVGKVTRLEQIFGNLLTNAVKFQRPGIQPEIIVTCKDQENEWQFSVQDNGIGIDSKHFEKIFGIFERLHTQDEFEGTGIGLAIVEKAVKEQGGRIWVTSQLGCGSTFSFTIPKHIQED
jgi:PAS domain S-box-containing protein